MRTYSEEELDRKIDAFLSKKIPGSRPGGRTIDVIEETTTERFSASTVRFLPRGLQSQSPVTHLV